MELQVLSTKAAKPVSVSDQVFAREYNESLVHQVLVATLANARQGTKAQKNRSAVRGGGKKPWRQKGTGNARSGTRSSPIWRSGGVTFAAKPRDYSQKVNRKMYRSAVSVMLSELARTDRLRAMQIDDLAEPKTKLLVKQLQDWQLDGRVLIVTADLLANLTLASRNMHAVNCVRLAQLSSADLVHADHVLIAVDAIKKLEEELA